MIRSKPLLRTPDTRARLSVPLMRPRTCKECRQKFTPTRGTIQPVCAAYGCNVAYAERLIAKKAALKAKEEKRADRVKRESLKTRSQWMKEAQIAFNAFCRARDRAAGHPCISSGRPLDWSGNAVDAGHYRSVGAAPQLRFHEDNCHAQSKHDNQYLAGNAVEYRRRLVERIGLERVEALEADETPRHYSIDDLKAIKTKYRALANQLAKEQK